MAFVNLKPGTLLAPVPAALITSGAERGGRIVRNLMTAAWVGTVCSDPPMVSVSIRPSRFTCDLVEESGEFVVCLTDKSCSGPRITAASVPVGTRISSPPVR